MLYVEQEVHGDDTAALQAVLSADVWRERLLAEEKDLINSSSDEGAKRLAEVHQLLQDIDADTGPARAAELLYGLGFTTEDQVRFGVASYASSSLSSRTVSADALILWRVAHATIACPGSLLQTRPSHGSLPSVVFAVSCVMNVTARRAVEQPGSQRSGLARRLLSDNVAKYAGRCFPRQSFPRCGSNGHRASTFSTARLL